MKSKVLVVHNHYQLPGGEDAVFAAESKLLEENGHEVVRLTVHNDALEQRSPAAIALETVWNGREFARMRALLTKERPALVHCHNTFPQLSPAIYYAAQRQGIPVVQTLHNFRLTCVNGLLFRDGAVCDTCVGSFSPWRGMVHACYRGSRPASAAAASMVAVHKLAGTYRQQVDMYIALTDFARERFVAFGLPGERVTVKPNFARDGGVPDFSGARDGVLYVGRLSEEKGCMLLIDAARHLKSRATITIVGDGPMREEVARASADLPNVQLLGRCAPDEVYARMRSAAAVAIPSLCYEMFPVVAAEAFAAGAPVIASGHGGLVSIVEDGRTGRLFPPGDAIALARAIDELVEAPESVRRMGVAARARYEASYSPRANYAQLTAIYDGVLSTRMARSA